MAFTEKQLPVSRQKHFQFFASSATTMTEELIPEYAFEVEKIRLRLSTAHASIIDFMVTLSHHMGSYYDQNLLSHAMTGVRDVLLQFNPTLKMHLNDTIDFSMIISASNIYGLEITGWAITETPRA